jgi:hypothetical protein
VGGLWPSKRDDGTVSVAVRLEVAELVSIKAVKRCVAQWFAEKSGAGIDLARDLSTPPHTEIVGPAGIDVVFDGTSNSRRWKDWMVDLTRELYVLSGVRVCGFEDRVSGTCRALWDQADG